MNSFTFYHNYYELIKYLNNEDRLALYDAIFKYMFEEEDTEFDGLNKGIWTNLKMPLNTSKKQYLNGIKGGAPVGNDNAKKIVKQNNPKTTQKQPNPQPKNKQIYISSFLFLFSNLNISNLNNKNNIYKLLEEYLELRNKNKYVVSETVVKRLINKLNEYGTTDELKEEIILKAINGKWKDFYPIDQKELLMREIKEKPKLDLYDYDWFEDGDDSGE